MSKRLSVWVALSYTASVGKLERQLSLPANEAVLNGGAMDPQGVRETYFRAKILLNTKNISFEISAVMTWYIEK
jgi:hypothetical protein